MKLDASLSDLQHLDVHKKRAEVKILGPTLRQDEAAFLERGRNRANQLMSTVAGSTFPSKLSQRPSTTPDVQMSAERKRKAPDQQSAVARLRRARGSVSHPSSRGSSPPLQARTAASSQAKQNGHLQTRTDRSKRREVTKHLTADPAPATEENQFSALPYKQSWDGNRIYERVSNTQLRVELAQGTGCVILGKCTIWVKHGTVSILGANLAAGPTLWPLSIPNCAALPSIEARSDSAEFELGVEYDAFGHSALAKEYFQPPEGLQDVANDLPFFILGLNFQFNSAVPKQLPILDVQEEHLRSIRPRGDPASILVCGPRSSGIATLARCLINRALTAAPTGRPVICVDLDTSLPLLGPVGATSVSLVSRPLLEQHSADLGRHGLQVDCWHFVGPSDTLLQPSTWHRACIADIAMRISRLKLEHPQASVVVLAREHLTFDKPEQAHAFSKKLALTTIVTIERNGSSPTDPAIQAMGEDLRLPIKSVPPLNENPHTGKQHQLSLQAYFGTQLQPWMGINNLNLAYNGVNTRLLAVTLSQGSIPTSHLERVLPGLIVAVAAIKRHTTEAAKSSIRHCKTSHVPILRSLSSVGLEPRAVQCRVLALVSKVDVETGIIRVRVPLPGPDIIPGMEVDEKLVLIVQPPSRDGKFAIHS